MSLPDIGWPLATVLISLILATAGVVISYIHNRYED